MTVEELIEKLQKFNPKCEVVDYEDCIFDMVWYNTDNDSVVIE